MQSGGLTSQTDWQSNGEGCLTRYPKWKKWMKQLYGTEVASNIPNCQFSSS